MPNEQQYKLLSIANQPSVSSADHHISITSVRKT